MGALSRSSSLDHEVHDSDFGLSNEQLLGASSHHAPEASLSAEIPALLNLPVLIEVNGSSTDLANGTYAMILGEQMNGRPMYEKKEDDNHIRQASTMGPSIIFFDRFWKLNCENNTEGWDLAVQGSIGSEPPEWNWTTFGSTDAIANSEIYHTE